MIFALCVLSKSFVECAKQNKSLLHHSASLRASYNWLQHSRSSKLLRTFSSAVASRYADVTFVKGIYIRERHLTFVLAWQLELPALFLSQYLLQCYLMLCFSAKHIWVSSGNTAATWPLILLQFWVKIFFIILKNSGSFRGDCDRCPYTFRIPNHIIEMKENVLALIRANR
jgi:hypothetical protein